MTSICVRERDLGAQTSWINLLSKGRGVHNQPILSVQNSPKFEGEAVQVVRNFQFFTKIGGQNSRILSALDACVDEQTGCLKNKPAFLHCLIQILVVQLINLPQTFS